MFTYLDDDNDAPDNNHNFSRVIEASPNGLEKLKMKFLRMIIPPFVHTTMAGKLRGLKNLALWAYFSMPNSFATLVDHCPLIEIVELSPDIDDIYSLPGNWPERFVGSDGVEAVEAVFPHR